MPVAARQAGLTGNQLKILAMIAMTIDHVGMQLFPQLLILRIIGRLAMPIYAWMIAEGCRHTRDRRKYLLRMVSMAALCQAVSYFAMGSLYQCILVTFSLSICLICALDRGSRWLSVGAVLAVGSICIALPLLIPGFDVDYGFFGALLPVAVYLGRTHRQKLLYASLPLVLLAAEYGSVQWYALAALPLLALYNGQRGKANIGKLFYWYYPIHLVVIYGISLLI